MCLLHRGRHQALPIWQQHHLCTDTSLHCTDNSLLSIVLHCIALSTTFALIPLCIALLCTLHCTSLHNALISLNHLCTSTALRCSEHCTVIRLKLCSSVICFDTSILFFCPALQCIAMHSYQSQSFAIPCIHVFNHIFFHCTNLISL